jgi:hypothetical protein
LTVAGAGNRGQTADKASATRLPVLPSNRRLKCSVTIGLHRFYRSLS